MYSIKNIIDPLTKEQLTELYNVLESHGLLQSEGPDQYITDLEKPLNYVRIEEVNADGLDYEDQGGGDIHDQMARALGAMAG